VRSRLELVAQGIPWPILNNGATAPSQPDGTETGATMKLSTFGTPFLMSLVPAVSAAADKDNYGQYFCYAEHVA
jgi:hypothetical protein